MVCIINVGLFVFSTTLLYVLYKTPFSLFTYHPLLILVALVCITEGIAGIQLKKKVSDKGKSIHAVLQGVGFTAMTFGFTVIYYNKDLNSKPHFTTTHGKLGSVTFTYMLIQLLFGILAAYVPSLFGGVARAKSLYRYHRISGYFLFSLLWVTALYGVKTPFLLVGHEYVRYIYYISVTCLTLALLSLAQPRKLGFNAAEKTKKQINGL